MIVFSSILLERTILQGNMKNNSSLIIYLQLPLLLQENFMILRVDQ